MTANPHFQPAADWESARALLTFTPVEPRHTAGLPLQSIAIHVRDHKMRELPIEDRSLEAYYGRFVLSQARKRTTREARRLALEVPYGSEPREALIAGLPARTYELGPEPEPGDIDGRPPAVVVWHDAEMFYLVASDQMQSEELLRIALSLHVG